MSGDVVHFQGLLANVDETIREVDFGAGVTVKAVPAKECQGWGMDPDYHPQLVSDHQIFILESQVDLGPTNDHPSGLVYKATSGLMQRIRLMRLFREGNIDLAGIKAWVTDKWRFQGLALGHTIDRQRFILHEDELEPLRSFLSSTSWPFVSKEANLAFEYFELSYMTMSPNMAFVPLVTALEVMLSDGGAEKTYRVSRNAAILLATDRQGASVAFRDIKTLCDKRGRLVHDGKKVTREDILLLRDYVRRLLKLLVKDRVSKKHLLAVLDTLGFGDKLPTDLRETL